MDRLATLLTMARDKPKDPFLLFALALEYHGAGNEAESRSYFERLVYEHPDYIATYYQYGKMEEEKRVAQSDFYVFANIIAFSGTQIGFCLKFNP